MKGGSENRNPSSWIESWHVTPSLSRDYDVIDGLRGVAILMVVVCHVLYINPNAGPTVRIISSFFWTGTWGVTIFFALSGFLISHPFWKRKIQRAEQVVPPGYARRRFWKIYPPLALAVLLMTPIYLATNKENAPDYLVAAGQWLVGWSWIRPVSGRLNPAMWSLIVEVHFYVVLPLLFIFLRRLSATACLWAIFSLLLVVPTGARWWNLSHGIQFDIHPRILVHFPSLLDAFAFGVLMAGLENLQIMRRSWAKLGDAGCALLLLSMLTMTWLALHPIVDHSIQLEALTLLVKIASAMMLCYVADPNHPRSRLFSASWLRWCGLISYEWYLFHQPFFFWIRALYGPAGGNFARYILIIGTAFLTGMLIGAIVYRFYSLPILRYGRNRRGVL